MTHDAASPSPLYGQNIELLRQGAALADRLDAGSFGPRDGVSGIGAHLRHCMDCYRCFLRGAGDGDGRIDYDARERDTVVEMEPPAAAAALRALADRLASLGQPVHRQVEIKVDTPPGSARDEAARWQRSSIGRELQFLISHTIHHYAMVALLLRPLGIDPGDDFGVAPATLAHRREIAACAR